MKPYEWMVTYTPQTEWIKGSGAVVWLSFVTGLLGGGSYLASLYFGSLSGTIGSWLIIAILKGALHVGHAKKPFRLWRIVLRVRTSWIARGTVFTGMAGLFGAVQIIFSLALPGTPAETTFKVLTAIAVVAVMIYEGFTINYISGIPFWNSSLLPATLIAWGVLSGLGLASLSLSVSGDVTVHATASRVSLLVTIALTVLYLWNALYAEAASKASMKEMLSGPLFWVGVVIIGMVIPLFAVFSDDVLGVPLALSFLVCAVTGLLAFSYSVLKVGVYRPLI
jgi:formate-dependent nitrite reductase membrane component NrfD